MMPMYNVQGHNLNQKAKESAKQHFTVWVYGKKM